MIRTRTAVLVCAALLASCSSAPRKETVPRPAPVPVPQPAPPPSTGITFAAVGDIMMGTDYPTNILPDDDGVGFLSNVAPVLTAADVAFGNLEGVLMDGGEPVKRCKPTSKTQSKSIPHLPTSTAPAQTAATEPEPETTSESDGSASSVPRQSAAPASETSASEPGPARTAEPGSAPPQTPVTGGSCYVFRSPTRYAAYLRDAGFDVLSLANNHAQDFGDLGRDSTMRALDAVGIRHSGRDGDIAEWTSGGRRFALVAFAPNIGSHQLNDLARARDIVAALAARNDIVVVSFHGGAEGEGSSRLPFTREFYQGEDRGDVVEFAHAVIDAGADLVIGHGPHVLRALELYRDRLIAYSLGNFATYYGISVAGVRGIAGILTTRLGDDGRFLEARFDSTIQIRPAGPTLDPARRGLIVLRGLTAEAFPAGRLTLEDDGRITRKP